jgi:hypothetical protein
VSRVDRLLCWILVQVPALVLVGQYQASKQVLQIAMLLTKE